MKCSYSGRYCENDDNSCEWCSQLRPTDKLVKMFYFNAKILVKGKNTADMANFRFRTFYEMSKVLNKYLRCKRFKMKDIGKGLINQRTDTWVYDEEIKALEEFKNIKMEVGN